MTSENTQSSPKHFLDGWTSNILLFGVPLAAFESYGFWKAAYSDVWGITAWVAFVLLFVLEAVVSGSICFLIDKMILSKFRGRWKSPTDNQ